MRTLSHKPISHFAFYALFSVLLLRLTLPPVHASEAVKLAGMGGAFVGLYNDEGGIFGNPAGLINTKANNLSVALSAQDMDYENLPLGDDAQMNTRLSFRLNPSVYYSRTIRGIGICLGYVDDLNNRSSTFKIENTEAEYIVNERKFISDTDTVLEYDFFRDKGVILSIGCPIMPELAVGVRMKYKQRIVKEGTIHRPLRLTAVHEEDVNRNDPTKLIPAIIDNLDIGDSIDRFKEGEDSRDDVTADLSGSGFDFDLGMQAQLFASGNVSAGFMLEHLIQQRIVSPQPSGVRFGIAARPTKWLVAALDLQKALDNGGLNTNLGWEIHHRWQRWFSGGIMIRSGFAHEPPDNLPSGNAKDKLSIGIGLILGDSHWDYTLVKPLDGSPIHRAAHMFSSTVRF